MTDYLAIYRAALLNARLNQSGDEVAQAVKEVVNAVIEDASWKCCELGDRGRIKKMRIE